MQSSLRFQCPGCRATIKAPAQLCGQTRLCPGCGRLLLVPDPSRQDGRRFQQQKDRGLPKLAPRLQPSTGENDGDAVIQLQCPSCKATIRASVHFRGQIRACPGCRRNLLVREQPPEDMAPKLLLDFGAALHRGLRA
jgi:hypothetical protein